MRLTLKIKLLPTDRQAELLLATMRTANEACRVMSEVAWQKKVFNRVQLHHKVYYSCKEDFKLSAQMVAQCINKVVDSYKLGKKNKRRFRLLGAIAYDHRILSYKADHVVSLWCLGGRQKIKFVCHHPHYFSLRKGEAQLVYRKGKFFLHQSVEVPQKDASQVQQYIDCDFGITDIVVTSDGTGHPAEKLNSYREHRQKVRSSLGGKGSHFQAFYQKELQEVVPTAQGQRKNSRSNCQSYHCKIDCLFRQRTG